MQSFFLLINVLLYVGWREEATPVSYVNERTLLVGQKTRLTLPQIAGRRVNVQKRLFFEALECLLH